MRRLIATIIFILFSQISFSAGINLWSELAKNFKLKDQSTRAEVKKQIRWLILHPTYLKALAKNSRPYIYFILEEVKKNNLPGELALLPMIESNYNPFAYSHAGAAGMWQLMPGTGSGLGIKQNWWYDGRRAVITSTLAALDYMTYLGRFFKGNWIYAVAAYDAGEGTIQRAVRKNISLKKSTDFWSLAIPRETKAYIPRLLAMASIIKYQRYFGVKLEFEEYKPYFTEVPIRAQIDLNHAANLAGIKYEELLKLNPGHNRWTTAPNKDNNSLLLPINSVPTFMTNVEKTPHTKFIGWARYQVKKGDTLSVIALNNHSTLNIIKGVNKLNNNIIKPGQKLIIPQSKHIHPITISEAKRKIAINRSKKVGPSQLIHIIKKGDSLSSVSKKYHVRQAQIIYWNQLKKTKLLPKQKLLIWKKKAKITTKAKLHIVKNGDNLSKIALYYHTSVKNLMSLNPKLKTSKIIKLKQKIKIA